jgi:hypothetical protein
MLPVRRCSFSDPLVTDLVTEMAIKKLLCQDAVKFVPLFSDLQLLVLSYLCHMETEKVDIAWRICKAVRSNKTALGLLAIKCIDKLWFSGIVFAKGAASANILGDVKKMSAHRLLRALEYLAVEHKIPIKIIVIAWRDQDIVNEVFMTRNEMFVGLDNSVRKSPPFALRSTPSNLELGPVKNRVVIRQVYD